MLATLFKVINIDNKNWEGSTEDFAKIVAELAEKKDLIDKDQFPMFDW